MEFPVHAILVSLIPGIADIVKMLCQQGFQPAVPTINSKPADVRLYNSDRAVPS